MHILAHFPCASDFLPRLIRFILIWSNSEKEVYVGLAHIYKSCYPIKYKDVRKCIQKSFRCICFVDESYCFFSHCCSSRHSRQHINYVKYAFLFIHSYFIHFQLALEQKRVILNEVFIKSYIQAYSCFSGGGAVIMIHHFYTLFIVVLYQSSQNISQELKVLSCEKVIQK